jgi:thiol-disulfide isomerase/thioredoxin
MSKLGRLAGAGILFFLVNGCAASGAIAVGKAQTTAAETPKAADPPAETPKADPPAEPADDGEPGVQTPFSQVVREARARGVPILLYFHTEWCEPCKTIASDVLPNEDVQAALGNWRFQEYDAEKDYGGDAALRFMVSSFPTLITISPNGEEVDRTYAPTEPDALRRRLARWLEPARKGPLATAEVRTNHEPLRLLAAAHVAERADRPVAAREFYKATIRADVGGRDGAGPEASVTLMKLKARSVVRKDHAARLRRHLERYQDSEAAGIALEGLGALAPESLPVPMKLLRRAGAAVQTARANDAWGLDRLALALDRLGDAEGAASAREAAAKAPRKELPVMAQIFAKRLHDPLEPSPQDVLAGAGGTVKVK